MPPLLFTCLVVSLRIDDDFGVVDVALRIYVEVGYPA